MAAVRRDNRHISRQHNCASVWCNMAQRKMGAVEGDWARPMTGDEQVSRSQSNAKAVACETEKRTYLVGTTECRLR